MLVPTHTEEERSVVDLRKTFLLMLFKHKTTASYVWIIYMLPAVLEKVTVYLLGF